VYDDPELSAFFISTIEDYWHRKRTVQGQLKAVTQVGEYYHGSQVDELQLQSLQLVGLRSVVNLRTEEEKGKVGMGIDSREAEICAGLGLDFVRIPVPVKDATAEHEAAALRAVQAAAKPVLVHSGVGGNRAERVVAAAVAAAPVSGQADKKQEGALGLDSFNQNEDAPVVHCMPHKGSSTCVYVVHDRVSKDCMIVDPVVDFVMAGGRYYFDHADLVIDYVLENGLKPIYLLETHVHADHITACQYIKEKFDGAPQITIGSQITAVQEYFSKAFNMSMPCDGTQFDKLIEDGDEFKLGAHVVRGIYTPGHTPVCTSYLVGDTCVFTGDTLFMPDIGTARCDFPGGSVEAMYDSCSKILSLAPETVVFIGHDYPGTRRPFRYGVTVSEQKVTNKMMKDGITKEEYVLLRTIRDSCLGPPNLLLPSLQVNIRAGQEPPRESNDVSYLKIPYARSDNKALQAKKQSTKMTAEQALKDYHDHSL
jgi:glyoxylase-like metal-dependent hydrolase (beta-lactamase superfamily II)/protein tyrosine phosphatase (PTP) superfamily phosphohydrolase (DUF442 family)